MVDLGGCSFTQKVQNAQDAGAIAVIVCMTVPGNPLNMSGSSTTITIPSVMARLDLCTEIRASQQNVNGSVAEDPASGVSRLDSSFDNGVIVHEYGHGISNRLTGGPAERECLQNQEQAGEGWSDYLGLIMTMDDNDFAEQVRGIGTYITNEPIRGGGIRPYPYSTNFFVNPHTYRNIASEFYPHGSGSVMCETLWEMTWDLIDVHGFDSDIYFGTGGNNIALQLVIDGMKLQPCSPGFLDVRDAILLADETNNGGANKCVIWNSFAKRGMGYSADQGSTNSRPDFVEGFDLPPDCIDELTIWKSISVDEGSPGDTVSFEIVIFNGSDDTLTNTVVVDSLLDGVSYLEGSINCGSSVSAGIVTIPLGTMMPGDELTCSFQTIIDDAFYTNYLFLDDMENGESNWLIEHGLGQADWELRDVNASSGSHAWYSRGVEVFSDQFLTMANPVSLTGENIRLRFNHSYRTEAFWDGGVVEISADGGQWEDLGSKFIQNGYAGPLESDNPMGVRDAFWGSSNGYISSVVDLDDYTGSDVIIRFRFATDNQLPNVGWYLDDVSIANEAVLSNTACVNSDQGFEACASIDEPPVVNDNDPPVSIEEVINTSKVFLYPNPTTGKVFVGATGIPSGNVTLSIHNMNGQLIDKHSLTADQLNAHFPLNLVNLSAGIYIIRIETIETTLTRKLIYQN